MLCYSTDKATMGKIRADRPAHRPSREQKKERELNLLRIKGDMKSYREYLQRRTK
jgi:hypothetical protein